MQEVLGQWILPIRNQVLVHAWIEGLTYQAYSPCPQKVAIEIRGKVAFKQAYFPGLVL